MLSRAASAARLAMFLALTAACQSGSPAAGDDGDRTAAERSRAGASAREIIDVHVHLTGPDNVAALVRALDAHGIDRAVIMASPHLAPHRRPADLGEYGDANNMVLATARDTPGRFIPFITLDLDTATLAELKTWLDRGACGVKLYHGHRSFHRRALDDPRYAPFFELLQARDVPVLLHVNTVRYRDELVRLVRRFDRMRVVCPHFCGSRTDLDRLAGILAELPDLLVDTSNGPGQPGIAGFSNLDKHGPRLRRMIERDPGRFLFGTDLVSNLSTGRDESEWELQIAANLGLLASEHYRFWRAPDATGARDGAGSTLGTYRGLDLPAPVLDQVLGHNARRWLASCL